MSKTCPARMISHVIFLICIVKYISDAHVHTILGNNNEYDVSTFYISRCRDGLGGHHQHLLVRNLHECYSTWCCGDSTLSCVGLAESAAFLVVLVLRVAHWFHQWDLLHKLALTLLNFHAYFVTTLLRVPSTTVLHFCISNLWSYSGEHFHIFANK